MISGRLVFSQAFRVRYVKVLKEDEVESKIRKKLRATLEPTYLSTPYLRYLTL